MSIKNTIISCALLTVLVPLLAFADATSTSFIIESDKPVAAGGRQTSDSFTNIASVADTFIGGRATSTSYSVDFGMGFWNAAHPGTLTVTDTSDVSATAAFTLSYASADPESPLFIACYGTVQADVESSCTGTATRALTNAFSYRFSGLTNNTTYYFRVYPLSGYDDSANPIISPYYSETVSASRTSSASVGDIFTPVSGSSGSGGGTSSGGSPGIVQVASEGSPAPEQTSPPAPPASIIERALAFLGFPIPSVLSTPSVSSVALTNPITPTAKPLAQNSQPSVVAPSAPAKPLLPARGVVLDEKTKIGVASARATIYVCPSPAARIAGCTAWESKMNTLTADSLGKFIFSVPAGIYRVRAEARGYESGESEPIIVAEAGKITVNIQLQKKSFWRRIFSW